MDKATQTMIKNLQKNSGKSLEEWIELVKKQDFQKHGEIMKFLKGEQGLSHGYANLVAHKSKETKEEQTSSTHDLIDTQYKGKEHFKSILSYLSKVAERLGNDVEFAPKKSYLSLRRKKQFAILKPATKTRFEIGLNLKGQETIGKLQAEKPNSMCSHKICISEENEIDAQVKNWIKKAYELAG